MDYDVYCLSAPTVALAFSIVEETRLTLRAADVATVAPQRRLVYFQRVLPA